LSVCSRGVALDSVSRSHRGVSLTARLAATVTLRAGALVLLAALTACGFQLRGSTNIPFKTFYIGVNDTSQLAVVLKRAIRGNGPTRLVSDPTKADAKLEVLSETEQSSILTINRVGEATEYNLYYHIRFRVSDAKGRDYIPITELVLKRLVLANANATLAENNEILLLYQDMQSDAAQQILRRVEAINPDVYYTPPQGSTAPTLPPPGS
jgi:LPS-assembly lipoprotein